LKTQFEEQNSTEKRKKLRIVKTLNKFGEKKSVVRFYDEGDSSSTSEL